MIQKLSYKKTILPNGLRIITVPMKHTNTVTSIVFVKTGSRYEKKEENGISHVLEHMFFSGTKRRPTKSGISKELDRIGALNNAFTKPDKTAYYIKTEAKYLDLSLDILSDMYLNAIFKPSALESERRVVVEEINMRKDDPAIQVQDNFEELLFKGNSLGWPVAGPIKTVLSLKREQFLNYVQTRYRAENTVIVVAGNIDSSKTVQKVKNYFKRVNTGVLPQYIPFTDTQTQPQLNISYKAVDQAHLVLGVKTISELDKRRYALNLASMILGGSSSSRLFTQVRDKLGLAYYVGATTSSFEDTGLFAAYAGLNLKKINLGISVMLKELRKIKEKKVTAQELKDAKTHIEGVLSLQLESSNFIAQIIGNSELIRNKIETPEEHLKQIQKVTAEEIQSIMKEVLSTKRLNLALIGPFKNKTPFEKILKNAKL